MAKKREASTVYNRRKKGVQAVERKGAEMFTRIRSVVARIPRGRVATYGGIATAAGFPGAARQAAWALRGAKGLPWHRVLGAGGYIRLPGEAGMEQRLRLETEGVPFRGRRVDLARCEWRKASAGTGR